MLSPCPRRPLTSLHITGSFTLSDIHSWVIFCLPDVSAKLNSSDGGSSVHHLYFRSTFLKTLLTCEYEKGRALFRSDSLTAISILKEVITKEATNKKINIQVDLDLKLDSISTFLGLLRPELDQHFTLNKKNGFIPPLREIATHELGGAAASAGGILQNLDQLSDFLQPSYIDILRHSETIESQFKAAPRHLDFLRGIVTDLFVDKHKLQGKSAQSRVPQLLEILENYSFDKLLAAFKE
jgi:Bardet-Biedl syndrome 7 protein